LAFRDVVYAYREAVIVESDSNRLWIYICHSLADKPSVHRLYANLCEAGLEPCLDDENLLAGNAWKEKIRRAVRGAHVVLVCLSRGSVKSTGGLQNEIGFALDVVDEQREGAPLVIPLRFDECEMSERLRGYHWTDLFVEGGFERLRRALLICSERAGLPMPAGASAGSTTVRAGKNRTDKQSRALRILHLSDLHFRSDVSPRATATELLTDVRVGLGIESVDYLVIAGDISDRCNRAGYEIGLEFLSELRYELKIPAQACIVVPGNYDLNFDIDAYTLSLCQVRPADGIQMRDLSLIPDPDRYETRFERFAAFYKQLIDIRII
jgi:hypothetical protein